MEFVSWGRLAGRDSRSGSTTLEKPDKGLRLVGDIKFIASVEKKARQKLAIINKQGKNRLTFVATREEMKMVLIHDGKKKGVNPWWAGEINARGQARSAGAADFRDTMNAEKSLGMH